MASDKLDPLNWDVPIVEAKTGKPTLEFMRKWRAQRVINAGILTIQQLLDSLSSVRGSIIYRGAAGWAGRIPGVAGAFLRTGGVDTDPTWVAASAAVQDLLDSLGTAQGDVLFRAAGGWTVLSAGTAGYVLTTGGAGADPAWVAGGGGGGGGTPDFGIPAFDPQNSAGFGSGFFGGRAILAPDAGNIASIAFYAVVASPTSTFYPAVYADASGSPGVLLADGPLVTGAVHGVNKLPLTAPLAVAKEDVLWIGFVLDVATLSIAKNPASVAAFFATSPGPPPNPAPATSYAALGFDSMWASQT